MAKCIICNYEAPQLHIHIKRVHNLSTRQYKAKFPNMPLMDDSVKQAMADKYQASKATRVKNQVIKQEVVKEQIKQITESKAENNRVYSKQDLELYGIIKQKYMSDYGFVEGPELEELLFLLITNKNLQEGYNSTILTGTIPEALSLDYLANIRDNNKRIQEMLVTLADLKDSREKTKDVIDLHKNTMAAAVKYIKENAGEFALRCASCGQMLDTHGWPHPFFEDELNKYSVFSREMWALVLGKKIPIEYAAYVLHTSIEGLLYTAKLRGDGLPAVDILEAESKLKELAGEGTVN